MRLFIIILLTAVTIPAFAEEPYLLRDLSIAPVSYDEGVENPKREDVTSAEKEEAAEPSELEGPHKPKPASQADKKPLIRND